MFESKTYELILDEMLDAVRDDVDKREGSIIFDALAPAALKLAEMYSDLDVFLNLTFADTADGEYLTRRAAEFGVFRKQATSAIRMGIFRDEDGLPLNVAVGSRFLFNGLNFFVIEELASGEYKLQAEETGIKGNLGSGTMLPIEPIENLGSAELDVVLFRGTDEETDSDLYERLKIRTQKQATSGNIYHYEQWARSVSDVGGVKIIPTWDGPNTVKVVLLNTEKLPAEPELVEKVFEYIEGERPIGAIVSATPAEELTVDITANIVLSTEGSLEDAEEQFTSALKKYFGEIAFTGELIRYTRIANMLLDVPSIVDYENLLVNGSTSNIELAIDEVGVVREVVFL